MNRAKIILILTASLMAAPIARGADADSSAGTSSAAVSPATQPSRSNQSGNNSDRQNNRRRRNRRTTGNTDTPSVSNANDPIPMAQDFQILTERSIFLKGRLNRNLGGGGDSGPATAEDQLVFNGVTQTDNQTVAFIEDTSTGKVQIVPVGQAIALGKITKITLEGLDYQSNNGRTSHVQVGQNLRGQDAWNQIYGMGTGTTTELPSNEPPPDAATAAIIARLKAKRMQELGGGAPNSSPVVSSPGATTAPSARP